MNYDQRLAYRSLGNPGKNYKPLIIAVVVILAAAAIFLFLLKIENNSGKGEGKIKSVSQQQSQNNPASKDDTKPPTPTPKKQEENLDQAPDINYSPADFELLSYKEKNQSREEFFENEKRILKIDSLSFDRITSISLDGKVKLKAVYKYSIKGVKTRTEMSDGSVIVAKEEGCFRNPAGSEVFYKYQSGEPEKNCRMHASWSKYTTEEFLAMADAKVLGTGNFQGKSCTIVQVSDSIVGTNYLLKVWISDENGLPLLAGGKTGNRKVTIEYKNYSFNVINDAIFDIPADKVTENSEIF
jgi:hypothetical protein